MQSAMPAEAWKRYSRHHTTGSQGISPVQSYTASIASLSVCALPSRGRWLRGMRRVPPRCCCARCEVTPCQTTVPALLLCALGLGSSGAGCSTACSRKSAWIPRSPSVGGHSSQVQHRSGRAVMASCSAEPPSCLCSPRQPFPSPGMGKTPSKIPNPGTGCAFKQVKHNPAQKQMSQGGS